MIPARYFDELGLQNDASITEVKKAYRNLAKQYHPDLNTSEEASEKFIQIREAYEILIGTRQVPRSFISDKEKVERNKARQKAKEDPEERARRQQAYREHRARMEFLRNENKHNPYRSGYRLKIFNTLVFACLLVVVLIVVDLSLPKKVSAHKIENWVPKEHSVFYDRKLYQLQYDKKRSVLTVEGQRLEGDHNEVFYLERSRIIQEPTKVIYNKDLVMMNFAVSNSIYQFLHIVAMFLIPTLIAWLFRHNVWVFRFLYFISLFSSGSFIIYFFFKKI